VCIQIIIKQDPKFGFPPDDFLASPNMLKHELPTFEIGVVALLATASLE
jgi:hypothetical protein